jgi:hypothetical protein
MTWGFIRMTYTQIPGKHNHAHRKKIIHHIVSMRYLRDRRGAMLRGKPKHKKYKKGYAEEPVYQNQSLKFQVLMIKLAFVSEEKMAVRQFPVHKIIRNNLNKNRDSSKKKKHKRIFKVDF